MVIHLLVDGTAQQEGRSIRLVDILPTSIEGVKFRISYPVANALERQPYHGSEALKHQKKRF